MVRETVLTPYDVYTADECFLTGTGAKLIPVKEIGHC
jgi:branched-chain amino acid aminotransferase